MSNKRRVLKNPLFDVHLHGELKDFATEMTNPKPVINSLHITSWCEGYNGGVGLNRKV